MNVEGAAIRGVGLCCSLGNSFAEAASAYVTGDRNFVMSDDLVGPDGLPLRVAPVFPVNEVRDFETRLQWLFKAAAEDLAASLPFPPAAAPLRLVVPDWLSGHPIADRLAGWIGETWPSLVSRVELVSVRDGMALVELARGLLAVNQRPQEALLVGALDSFIHAELLDMLAQDDRLLTRQQPHGIIPSEAAVLFYLAAGGASAASLPLGRIVAAWPAREEEDVRRPIGILGQGLSKGFSAALERAAPARLMVDLDGERWRSEELGFVLSAAPELPNDLEADFETPPLYAGHCGVATDALMAALALAEGAEAAQGPDDGSEIVLLASSHRDGGRVVALVERFIHETAPMEAAS